MTIWLTLTLLIGAGLITISLHHLGKSGSTAKSRNAGWMLALVLLALVVLLGPGAEVASGELAQNRLGRLAVSAVLLSSAIAWRRPRLKHSGPGKRLLVTAGAVMAVSANSLLTLWVGLLLFLLEGTINDLLDSKQSLVGILAVLGGTTMVYSAAGVMHLDALGHVITLHAGPQPIGLYTGLALLALGVALTTNLLGTSASDMPTTSRRMLLGLLLLLRIAGHVPTLWWEWRWALAIAAAAQAVITLDYWLQHGSRKSWDTSWMLMLHTAMLLLGLALCQTPLGLAAVLGLGLNLLLTIVVWHLLVAIGIDPAQGALCTGLISREPGPGIALGTALLSLAGLPITLGLQTRALLVQTLVAQEFGWPVWLLVAVFCLFGVLHVPNLIALIEGGRHPESQGRATWAHVSLYIAAAAMMMLGLSVAPLTYLARWLLHN